MKRLSPLLLLVSALLFSPHAAPGQAIKLDVLQKSGYGVVPIQRPEPNTLTVNVQINGRKVRLSLDTGWGDEGITVDQQFASSMKIATEPVKEFGRSATGAELQGVRKGRADTVTLGNVQMNGVPIYFGHFRSLSNVHMQRRSGLNGFLGAGFLKTCSAIVDLHNLRLYLRPPGTGSRVVIGPGLKAAGLAEVPLKIKGHGVYVDVEINGVPAHMVVDTGAYLAGVDERFADKLKTAQFRSNAASIDAAGVINRTKYAQVKSFKIGGVPVRVPDIRIDKFGFYAPSGGELVGLLGMDILGSNGAVVDFATQKLYFYPAQR